MSLPHPTARFCRLVSIAAISAAGLTMISLVLALLGFSTLSIDILPEGSEPLDGVPLMIAYFLTIVSIGLSLLVLMAIAGLFRVLAQGHVFSDRMPRAVRRLGRVILAFGFLSMMMPSLIATLAVIADGAIVLEGYISLATVMMVLIGATIMALAHVLKAAVELANENRQFV